MSSHCQCDVLDDNNLHTCRSITVAQPEDNAEDPLSIRGEFEGETQVLRR